MERKVTQELKGWRSRPDRRPLIVTGGRQIGKTYSIKEFVQNEYISSVYINFEDQPEKRILFSGDRTARDLISRIVMSEGVVLHPGSSAIVLDEIQACPQAYSALKPLSEDGRFDIICSGSFLGINLDDRDDSLSPLGYAEVLRMHPMDFEEYLWAMGIDKGLVAEIRRCVQELDHIDDYFHRVMTEHFRTYMVVGGMPAAVRMYSETLDYARTAGVLRNIVEMIKKDTGKYSRKAGRARIDRCLESIPRQLSRENKRFVAADVEKKKGVGRSVYANALNWLTESGLITVCSNLEEPNKPLSAKAMEGWFKVYMNDTGILMALMDGYDPIDIVMRDPFSNFGAVMECAVCSALVKKGYHVYYYSKRNSTLEIDFVIESGGTPMLMEVKSGRDRRAKSLTTLMAERDRKRIGCKIMDSNIEVDGKGIIHYPLYAPCFFGEVMVPDIPGPPSAEEVNRRFREMRGMRTGMG